jgi:hypothetical protein
LDPLETRCDDGKRHSSSDDSAVKAPVAPRELVRVVLIVALALPFVWNGYRPVHVEAFWLAALALFVILVVAMVRLWTDRPRLPLWRRVLPLVLCLLVPYVGAQFGVLVERLDFRYRRQIHYRHVVEMLERGEILSESTTTAAFRLPHPYEGEAYWAGVTRDALGGLRVEFAWTRHSSYLFCSRDACRAEPRRTVYRRINEEWLLVRR